MGTLLSRDELEQLPFLYRLLVKVLLKMPNPNLPFFILKRFPGFEGILWAVVAPILLIMSFFFIFWLFSLPSLHLGFPANLIILSGFIPAVVFVFFLRMQMERQILWWRNIHEPPKEWDTPKRVEELIELFEKQQVRKKL